MTDTATASNNNGSRVGARDIGRVGMGVAELALLDIDRDDAVATIHAALDAGVRHLDNAAAYTPSVDRPGWCEQLAARAVDSWGGADADDILVATKGGHHRVGEGLTPDTFGTDARPDSLRADIEGSLRALSRDVIDLYYLHWPDPNVPIEEVMGVLEVERAAGRIRHIGLSNMTVPMLDAASSVGRVNAVQNRYSVLHPDDDVLGWCIDNGATFVAYSPLGGLGDAANLATRLPDFAEVATNLGVSAHRLALAWLLRRSPTFHAIVGARRAHSIVDSAAAATVLLDDDLVARLDASVTRLNDEEAPR
ncbi:MAG: aryl-alcohol dehydrogenase-like predicted oxidoreductase [Glaciecola sp.]|jgi:aryl-alcohol dehydrogenase-like predicted oxidoreductase